MKTSFNNIFAYTFVALMASQVKANGFLRRIRRDLAVNSLFGGDLATADDTPEDADEDDYLIMSSNPIPPTPATTSPSPSSAPSVTFEPTDACPNREINLEQILFDISGDLINVSGTPQNKAKTWILNDDPLQLCPSLDCRFVQRYALAVFYYAAGGDGWSNCSQFESDSDCTNIPNEAGWTCNVRNDQRDPVRWLSGENECTWCGNECFPDTQCMRGIEIELNGQEGVLADEVSEMTGLQYFLLEQGKIEGEIPSIWGEKLLDMRTLDLDFEELTGSVPESIYTGMTRLLTLDLNDNFLTGGISTNIGLLSELIFFQIFNNTALTGPIPDEMVGLSQLEILGMQQTSLTGDVPDGMCNGNEINVTNLPRLVNLTTNCNVDCPCCTDPCQDP